MATLTLIPNSLVRFAHGTPNARTAVILKDGSFLQVKPKRQKFANGDEWTFSFMGPEATLYRGVESGKLIMEKQPKELVNLQDEDGNTALHRLTCWSDPYEMVRLLETEGVDPNIRNKKGETPLCVAAKDGWMEGMKKLAEYNVDMNIRMSDGEYLLHHIAKKEFWFFKYMLSSSPSLDLNVQTQDGSTVLHLVIQDRSRSLNLAIIKTAVLVEAGVDKTIQDKKGYTALHYAAVHYGSDRSYLEEFVPLLSA